MIGILTVYLIKSKSVQKSGSSFKDVILNSGISSEYYSSGVSWSDYDRDGYLDLYLNGKLYRNLGNGQFSDVTDQAKLKKTPLHAAGVFADYNNDGCPDLYVSNSSDQKTINTPGLADLFFLNNCDGTFTDITKKAGINDAYNSQGVAWGDFNNDGFLDLYVANFGTLVNSSYKYEPNILYKNNGDGTFTNITQKAGVTGETRCPNLIMKLPTVESIDGKQYKPSYQPIWFDYNNDGLLDLFVATDSLVSPLYRNNGNDTFTDVTYEAGLCRYGTGMGVTVGDYDNDGNLDLYVTNTGNNYLWRNNGDGTFSEVAYKANVADIGQGWGTHFFDYDNDGDLDLYVANGAIDRDKWKTDAEIKRRSTDIFYENIGNGKFIPVTREVGIYDQTIKRGAAFGDFNNDGFIDIYVVTFSYTGKVMHHLYQNQGNKNHWITIQLVGTKSNRDGVGAKVKVTAGGKSQIQQVISGSSFLSQNSLWLTFGLGRSKNINTIEISWPSGIKQTLTNIKADQKIVVSEKISNL